MQPSWIVEVSHASEGGRRKRFRSKPLTYSQARQLVDFYTATGHPVRMREVMSPVRPARARRCADCPRLDPHVHCPECGSVEHAASACEMEG